jgi:hypothetical protein
MNRFRPFLLIGVATAAALMSSCGKDSPKPQTYAMGDRVELGRLTYNVFETRWLTHIGEGVSARAPQNRFFLVRVSAANSSKADLLVPSMTIEDDSGNTYTELTNGEGVPQWLGFLRQVKPAEAAQGNIAFDAPPRHYKLRIADENEQKFAYIDIPLSFEADTPEMPIPEGGKKE